MIRLGVRVDSGPGHKCSVPGEVKYMCSFGLIKKFLSLDGTVDDESGESSKGNDDSISYPEPEEPGRKGLGYMKGSMRDIGQ